MREGAEFGWRALVGWIHSYGMLHHTTRDLYRLLPDGFGILFSTLGKRDQSAEETESALARIEEVTSLLARNGAEYFVTNSSPMVTHGGPGADKRIIEQISQASGGRPGTTTTTSGIRALKSLEIERIVLFSPYKARNAAMKTFIEAEGIQVVAEHGLTDDLTKIHRMPGETAYRVARNAVWDSPECDALYMPGGRLGVLDVVEELESDLGIPVIASTPAVVWEIRDHFGVQTPVEGFGRLLRDFPPNVEAAARS